MCTMNNNRLTPEEKKKVVIDLNRTANVYSFMGFDARQKLYETAAKNIEKRADISIDDLCNIVGLTIAENIHRNLNR